MYERKGGSDWHEEEVDDLIDLSATADPNEIDTPIDPEAEMFAELAPIVIHAGVLSFYGITKAAMFLINNSSTVLHSQNGRAFCIHEYL